MDRLLFSWECIGNESYYNVEQDSEVSSQSIAPELSEIGKEHSPK